MRNYQPIVGLVAAAVILFGAGVVFVWDKNKPASQPTSVAVKPSAANNATVSSGYITDIFSNNQNKKCTFDSKSDAGETKGLVYVSGDNAYAKFDMLNSGKTNTNYVIRNSGTFYMWGNSFPTGIKMTMSVKDLATNLSNSQYSQGLNANQKVDYSCSNWSPDNSLFKPPANVTFQNLGAMSNPTGGGASGSPSDQCSLCNSLTGSGKASCLSSFHCQK